MTFIKHTQTAIRIKRLTINLEYFNDELVTKAEKAIE